MTTAVLLCGVDDDSWADLPAVVPVAVLPDGPRLDDPTNALVWHAAFTWRATGDLRWWISSQPVPLDPKTLVGAA